MLATTLNAFAVQLKGTIERIAETSKEVANIESFNIFGCIPFGDYGYI